MQGLILPQRSISKEKYTKDIYFVFEKKFPPIEMFWWNTVLKICSSVEFDLTYFFSDLLKVSDEFSPFIDSTDPTKEKISNPLIWI